MRQWHNKPCEAQLFSKDFKITFKWQLNNLCSVLWNWQVQKQTRFFSLCIHSVFSQIPYFTIAVNVMLESQIYQSSAVVVIYALNCLFIIQQQDNCRQAHINAWIPRSYNFTVTYEFQPTSEHRLLNTVQWPNGFNVLNKLHKERAPTRPFFLLWGWRAISKQSRSRPSTTVLYWDKKYPALFLSPVVYSHSS